MKPAQERNSLWAGSALLFGYCGLVVLGAWTSNLILLMEDGRTVERGTHEELMNARGAMVVQQMESHAYDNEEVFR